jgi:hypothetical protein
VLQTSQTIIPPEPKMPDTSAIFRKSSGIEKILEYRLMADLAAELYRRGLDLSVLRDDVDCHGRDLLLEACGILRQVQLKAMTADGSRTRLSINLQLATKPSACIIWFDYDPVRLIPTSYRWFGGAPGERMPGLGSRVAQSTRANSFGEKPQRNGHRVLGKGRFETLHSISELTDRLFGAENGPAAQRQRLISHLTSRPVMNDAAWIEEVRVGAFSSIPERLDEDQVGALAHMIDGYELYGGGDISVAADFLEAQTQRARECGRWEGSATELWITLFLEHRRRHFAGELDQPDDRLFSLLEQQLRDALVALENS